MLSDPTGRPESRSVHETRQVHTRECLAIVVDRRLRSTDVIETLGELFVRRGTPEHIRSDNVLTTESNFLEKTTLPLAASGRTQRFCDPHWVAPVWSSTVGVIPALP